MGVTNTVESERQSEQVIADAEAGAQARSQLPAARVLLCHPTGNTEHIPLEQLLHGQQKTLPLLQEKNLIFLQGERGEQLNLCALLPEGSNPAEWQKAEGSLTLSGVTYALYQHHQYEAEFLVQIDMVANFY